MLELLQTQLPDLGENPPPLRLAEHPCQRRVLPQVIGLLAALHEGLPNLRNWSREERLPSIGVPKIDAPLLAPAIQRVPCLVDHWLAQSICHHPVIGEIPCSRAIVGIMREHGI